MSLHYKWISVDWCEQNELSLTDIIWSSFCLNTCLFVIEECLAVLEDSHLNKEKNVFPSSEIKFEDGTGGKIINSVTKWRFHQGLDWIWFQWNSACEGALEDLVLISVRWAWCTF